MGFIRKTASILTLSGVSSHSRRDPQAKVARAQAGLAEAEMEVAEEQAAVVARALHEDEAHRQADLEEVAEKEAEAVPWDRPACSDAALRQRPPVRSSMRAITCRDVHKIQPGQLPSPVTSHMNPRR